LRNDFDCYIALNEQTVLGLRENIFAQLTKSEYFLFIDFRREQLIYSDGSPPLAPSGSTSTRYRGSLFTHQELGIASFWRSKAWRFTKMGLKNATE